MTSNSKSSGLPAIAQSKLGTVDGGTTRKPSFAARKPEPAINDAHRVERYFAVYALATAIVLLTLTEVPIPLALLMPFLLIFAIPKFAYSIEKWVFASIALTVYDCIVGSIFVAATGTGVYKYAVYYSLRALAISVVVLLALRRASLQRITFVIGLWAALQLCGLIIQTKGYEPATLFPFDIYSVNLNQAILDRPVNGRFRGFTAESGVVGGMASIFLVLVVLTGYLRTRIRSIKRIETMLLAVTVMLLLSILGMTLTKSGVFLLAATFLALGAHAAFRQDWRTVFSAIRLSLVVGLGLFLLIYYSPTAQDYIEQEKVILMTSFENRGIEGVKDTGFGTRIAGIQLALLGVIDYPFGLGHEGLATFITKNVDRVETSIEMDEFSTSAWGPKCFGLDMLVWDGIPGFLLLIWMLALTVKPFGCAARHGFSSLSVALFIGLLSLSMAVEMLPFTGILSLVLCAGLALQREVAGEFQSA